MSFICFYYKARLLFCVRGQDLDMISMAFRKTDLMDFVWVLMRNCFLHIVFSAKEQTYLCFHCSGRNDSYLLTPRNRLTICQVVNTRSGHRNELPVPCPIRVIRILTSRITRTATFAGASLGCNHLPQRWRNEHGSGLLG